VRWLSNCLTSVRRRRVAFTVSESGVEEAAKEMGREEQEVDQTYLEPLKIFWTS
jgi:hypothetical protein